MVNSLRKSRRTRSSPTSLPIAEALESRALFAAQQPLYVNAGGASLIDSVGRPIAADVGFTAGAVSSSSYDFGNAADNAMFDSSRHGNQVAFHSPIVNGHYAVWLEFADTQSTAPGQRVMNGSIEGASVLSSYDVFASAGGANKPTAREFEVTVTNGALDINLTASTGEAFVNAIVAVPTDVPTSAQPYSWQGLSDSARSTAAAFALRQIGQMIEIYQTEKRGYAPADLATLQAYYGDGYTSYGDPRSDSQLPRGELSPLEQVAWVAARTDFIYTAAGTRNGSETTVWAYENPQRVSGSLYILYGDGHVGLLDRATAGTKFGFDPNAPLTGGPPVMSSAPADSKIQLALSNLQNIGTKLLYFSNDSNNGRGPVSIGDLVSGYSADPAWFVDPRSGTTPPAPGLSGDAGAAYVNSLSDYRYQRYDNSDLATRVVMYENPSTSSDGLLLLFADGSSAFREMRYAMETLRATGRNYSTTTPTAEIARIDPLLPNQSATLDGAGLMARTSLNTTISIAQYQWDFDYDGTTFNVDSTSVHPMFNAGSLPRSQTVALRVIDVNGAASNIATSVISILPITVSNGASYSFSNSTFTLNSGSATITADAANSLTGMTFIAIGGSTLTFNTTQHLKTLQLNDSAVATLVSGGGKFLDVNTLSLSGSAKLDLNDNAMIVDYDGSSPRTAEQSLIASGRAGGAWTGTGITSGTSKSNMLHNTTLGLLDSADYKSIYGQSATFDGQAIDLTALLIKYTYYGDADFNGKIDSGDYHQIDTGYQSQHNSGFLDDWFNGDFDYNGTINSQDYALMDQAYQTPLAGTIPPAYLPAGAKVGPVPSSSGAAVLRPSRPQILASH